MMTGKLFEHLVQLIYQLLGGVVDVSISLVDRYLWIVRRAVILSAPAVLVVAALVVLSELTGLKSFNVLAVLMSGFILVIWIVLAVPIVVSTEIVAAWAPVRRWLSLLGLVVLGTLSFAVMAARLGAGYSGLSLLLLALFCALLLGAFGYYPGRRFLLFQLVATLGWAVLVTVFPSTTNAVRWVAGGFDQSIASSVAVGAKELTMTSSILSGNEIPIPPLFKSHDGSPNWWCRSDPNALAGYRCFSQPGRDVTTGEVLTPITPIIVVTALSKLRDAEEAARNELERVRLEGEQAKREAEASAREATERALRDREAADREAKEKRRIESMERERAAIAEEEARKAAEIDADRVRYLHGGAEGVVGIAIIQGSSLDTTGAARIASAFGDGTVSFLKQPAVEAGIFAKLHEGDFGIVSRLDLGNRFAWIVLGVVKATSSPVPVTDLSRKAIIEIDLRILNLKENRSVRQKTIVASAEGQSEEIAFTRAWTAIDSLLNDEVAELRAKVGFGD